jgi:hypothetical protein
MNCRNLFQFKFCFTLPEISLHLGGTECSYYSQKPRFTMHDILWSWLHIRTAWSSYSEPRVRPIWDLQSCGNCDLPNSFRQTRTIETQPTSMVILIYMLFRCVGQSFTRRSPCNTYSLNIVETSFFTFCISNLPSNCGCIQCSGQHFALVVYFNVSLHIHEFGIWASTHW